MVMRDRILSSGAFFWMLLGVDSAPLSVLDTQCDDDDVFRKEEETVTNEQCDKPKGGTVGNRGMSDRKKKALNAKNALRDAIGGGKYGLFF